MTKNAKTVERHEKDHVFDPQRWGLPPEAISDLANRLRRIWFRFKDCFITKTRDTSQYAFMYMRGLLTMDTKRNYTNISHRVIDLEDDGQNLQHFMSDSPWSSQEVFHQIQDEISFYSELKGGMLTLDESGDKRSGEDSAGTARQHIGRLGKVDMGQVGVVLGYYQLHTWAMVDAELYLPEAWFDDKHKKLRKRWHIPEERTFATKIQLGMEMIQRARDRGFDFEVLGCDTLYGRDSQFRAELDSQNIHYMADIPANIHVYLNKPLMGIPKRKPGKQGRTPSRLQVLNDVKPVDVSALAHDMPLTSVPIRYGERGLVEYDCVARQVWTVTETGEVRQEWLFIRLEINGEFSFSLSNVPTNCSETNCFHLDTPLEKLAFWRCERYFAERIFQDAKTEAGWDELAARKYRAWMHHTALDALALWFIAQTKLDWSQQYPRDSELARQLEVVVLPALSMANIREMLKAVLPLKQLSPQEAVQLVIKHLVNRSCSTSSRMKSKGKTHKHFDDS